MPFSKVREAPQPTGKEGGWINCTAGTQTQMPFSRVSAAPNSPTGGGVDQLYCGEANADAVFKGEQGPKQPTGRGEGGDGSGLGGGGRRCRFQG